MINDKILLIALIGVMITGLYFRLSGIVVGNFGFTHDQGRDLLEAAKIVNGDFTLIGPTTGLWGVYHGPLWYYVLAFFSFFGSGNPKVVLGGIILVFLLAQIGLFLTIKKFYGVWPALFSSCVISLSPLYIASNGQLWSPNMTLFSMIIYSIALIHILNGKKWYWLLGLALGINLQFEAAGGLFLLITTLITLVILKPQRLKLKDGLFGIGVFLVTLVPHAVFELRHGYLMSKLVLNYLQNPHKDFIAEFGIKTLEYRTGLFIENFNRIFFTKNTMLMLLFLTTLFILALYTLKVNLKIKNNIKSLIVWSLTMIFLMFIIINLHVDVVWQHFLYGVSIFYILIVTFLLDIYRKYFPKVTTIVTMIVLGYMLIPLIGNFNVQGKIVGDLSYYKNQLKIIDEVYNDSSGQEFNVVVYTPTTFSYTYDYLFSWYGKNKYKREPVPNELKMQVAYYIVEPDSIQGRREKWLKEREGEGEIFWEKNYWNGLLLQKRIR